MSLIDDTFAPIPKRILNDWGQNITYIKTTTPRTYDPATGAVTGDDTSVRPDVVRPSVYRGSGAVNACGTDGAVCGNKS